MNHRRLQKSEKLFFFKDWMDKYHLERSSADKSDILTDNVTFLFTRERRTRLQATVKLV